jgi:hypothetical protein
MRDQLEPVAVAGEFDTLAREINMQMQIQGRHMIAFQDPDGIPLAINYNNINVIRPQSAEDAFAQTGAF